MTDADLVPLLELAARRRNCDVRPAPHDPYEWRVVAGGDDPEPIGAGEDGPIVARFFARQLLLAPQQPDQRLPRQEGHDQFNQHARPTVAPFRMGQFVDKDAEPALVVV